MLMKSGTLRREDTAIKKPKKVIFSFLSLFQLTNSIFVEWIPGVEFQYFDNPFLESTLFTYYHSALSATSRHMA